MRINKTFTLSFYSRLHRHVNEIALAASFSKPFHFVVTFGEWSWIFGVGIEDDMSLSWWGPYLSYMMMPYNRSVGFFSAGISSGIYWESS